MISASTISAEIGYGNAAGLLFRKGFSGLPSARIAETSEQPRRTIPFEMRHPITSLQRSEPSDSTSTMSPEEKEREAERLFVLFDRMERNPMLSAATGDGKHKGIKEAVRDKMEEGNGDEWEEEERRREAEEDQKDEEEAEKEMKAYRERVGRM